MTPKRIMAASLLLFVLTVFLCSFASTPAYGVEAAEQTGLGSVFKKRAATGVGPTKVELGITIGATIVMIAVVKFL